MKPHSGDHRRWTSTYLPSGNVDGPGLVTVVGVLLEPVTREVDLTTLPSQINVTSTHPWTQKEIKGPIAKYLTDYIACNGGLGTKASLGFYTSKLFYFTPFRNVCLVMFPCA